MNEWACLKCTTFYFYELVRLALRGYSYPEELCQIKTAAKRKDDIDVLNLCKDKAAGVNVLFRCK